MSGNELTPTGVSYDELAHWFNELSAQVDRDSEQMLQAVMLEPDLADPSLNARRDREIGEINGRKKTLLDFKGFLIARSVLDVDEIAPLLKD